MTITHGTDNGYGNYGCRCGDCYTAWKAANLRRLTNATHGTQTAYQYGCRCDQCRTAHAACKRVYVAKKATR